MANMSTLLDSSYSDLTSAKSLKCENPLAPGRGNPFAPVPGLVVDERAHTTPGASSPPVKPRKKSYTARRTVCETCGKIYASNSALSYHQRVHTGERPYQCSSCPKNFTMPSILRNHIRSHTGEKPYVCVHCHKKFGSQSGLLRHDTVHTGVKPYLCVICGRHFSQASAVKVHQQNVHQKISIDAKQYAPNKTPTANIPPISFVSKMAGTQASERRDKDEGEVGVETKASEDDGTYHMYFDKITIEDSDYISHEVEIGPSEMMVSEVEDQINL